MKATTTKTGPNDARRVVWAISEFIESFFILLMHFYVQIECTATHHHPCPQRQQWVLEKTRLRGLEPRYVIFLLFFPLLFFISFYLIPFTCRLYDYHLLAPPIPMVMTTRQRIENRGVELKEDSDSDSTTDNNDKEDNEDEDKDKNNEDEDDAIRVVWANSTCFFFHFGFFFLY